MNWAHLQTMLWLRWQLSRNQWRRAGLLNMILMIMIVSSTFALAISSFFVALGVGLFLLPKATPAQFMLAWDAMVLIFLVVWFISLIIEVQRSEMLSLERLLHLPISLRGAFFLNYVTSFISLGLLSFALAGLGLSLAAIVAIGSRMILLIPLIVGFLALVTATTYQFRGWLVSLMSTKRRRQTVIATLTIGMIVVTQIPNMFIQIGLRRTRQEPVPQDVVILELMAKLQSQEIDLPTYESELAAHRDAMVEKGRAEDEAKFREITEYARQINFYLPIGWLPLGSMELFNGRWWPSLLGSFGMLALAGASLRRAYVSTIRQFTHSGGASAKTIVVKKAQPFRGVTDSTLDRQLPIIGEQTSAVALASWVHLLRSPEAKLALIGPMFIMIFLIVIIATNPFTQVPKGVEGFVLLGAIALITFFHLVLSMNIFATDRGGFRSYVLMPIRRRDILIGKNLSVIPILGVIACVSIGVACYFAMPSFTTLLACMLQLVVVFFMTSLAGNITSIYFPMAIVPGTSKPARVSLVAVLVQMLITMFFPIALSPAAAAIAAEYALAHYANIRYLPIFLIVSLIEAAAAIWIYRKVIAWQGDLLQSRETKILEVVTSITE